MYLLFIVSKIKIELIDYTQIILYDFQNKIEKKETKKVFMLFNTNTRVKNEYEVKNA